MIHLIWENDLEEFSAAGDIVIRLSDGCDSGEAVDGLCLDDSLAIWWDTVEHNEENWKRVQEIECKRLQDYWAVDYLCIASNLGKTVNVICTCIDNNFCFRRILNEILVSRNVDVFMR